MSFKVGQIMTVTGIPRADASTDVVFFILTFQNKDVAFSDWVFIVSLLKLPQGT